MASIRRLPSGRYRVRWRDADGVEHGVTLRRHKEALQHKSDVESEASRGIYRDPAAGRQPFEQFLAATLESDLRLSRATRALYETQARLYVLPALGSRPLAGIRPADIRGLYSDLAKQGKGAATIEVVHRLISKVLAQAFSDGIIAANPASKSPPPRPVRKPPRILSPDEIERLADAIRPARYRALILTAAYTGLRFGELAALRESRVHEDLDPPRLEVVEALSETRGRLQFGPTKTGTARTVPIPRFLAEEILDHLQTFVWPERIERDRARLRDLGLEEEWKRLNDITARNPDLPGVDLETAEGRAAYFAARDALRGPANKASAEIKRIAAEVFEPMNALVFTSNVGRPLSRTRFRARYWLPAVQRVGIQPPPNFHDLRHSAAAMAIAKGAHPKEIQVRLGHTSIRTTLDVYGGLFPSLDAQLASGLDEVRAGAVARMRHEGPESADAAVVPSKGNRP